MISRYGIGVDMIDLDAATRRGIAVANTPYYCLEEVSAHALALILGLTRQIVALDQSVRGGSWNGPGDGPEAKRLSMTTLSIVGFGRLGSLTAAGAAALGFKVLVHDPYLSDERIFAAGHTPVTLERALTDGDVVSLHVPLNSSTHHLIGAPEIAMMRPGGFLVNTCRGGLIDESALAEALFDHRLAGAGLDVFEEEPLPAGSPLREAPGTILTPHTAWYSPMAAADLPVHAARQVVEFLRGEEVDAILNPTYSLT
jgi:D-3-phosphoglycerate dehydrogenase